MEFLVCCVFAYWFVKHVPEIAGETAEAIAAAWNGQESPRLKARRERLDDAGIDPAAGGAFGQYIGNLWNDFWLDQDNKRRRGDSSPNKPRTGLIGKIRAAFDAEVGKRSQAWKRRNPAARDTTSGEPHPDGWTAPTEDPIQNSFDEPPTAPADSEVPPNGYREEQFTPGPRPRPTATPGPPAEPVRVPSTVGEPINDSRGTATAVLDPPIEFEREPQMNLDPSLLQFVENEDKEHASPGCSNCGNTPIYGHGMCHTCLYTEAGNDPTSRIAAPRNTEPASTDEGNPDMTQALHTNGGAVTGVVSGAAEARAIQRYLEQATAAYDAAMAQARKRIHALGEQTVGVVQLATKSDVVDATAQAAESIAAAQAGANTCKAETIPLLGLVARHFDRRNS